MSRSNEPAADDEHASGAVPIRFFDLRLGPDPTRTALRPFLPGELPEPFAHAESRCQRIVGRALAFDGDALAAEIARTVDPLRGRHRDPDRVLLARYEEIAARV